MTQNQKNRLLAVSGIVLALSLFVFCLLQVLNDNINLYLTPHELQQQPRTDRVVRLGGVVVPGTIQRGTGTLVHFQVQGEQEDRLEVQYRGVLPDLFREGQGVVALGRLAGTYFEATQLLAKHDESYQPRARKVTDDAR